MRIRSQRGISKRRITQLVCAALYNANIKGFAKGEIYQGKSKGLCVPGLNCYSCPGAVAACPLGAFQSALLSSPYKLPYYALGMLLLFGGVLGRFICGFLCPFGLIQELLYLIPGPKWKKSRFTRALSYGKYVILLIFVLGIPLLLKEPGFCKFICPAGTLEGGIPLTTAQEEIRALAGILFIWKLALAILILLLAAACYRFFCRFLCPLGAFYSLFAGKSLVSLQVDEETCDDCGACMQVCLTDCKKVGDRECVCCMRCAKVCPKKAISFKNHGQRSTLSLVLPLIGLALIIVGLMEGGFGDVLNKAVYICFECIGIG